MERVCLRAARLKPGARRHAFMRAGVFERKVGVGTRLFLCARAKAVLHKNTLPCVTDKD
ncbi:hypothetical protein [Paenibacillus elgii]|uniref:hypothetical protein n=1 Tax=Paenibacillus elgii TaxID=189691 RepID=UPI0013D1E318|nr:hypothetical protein [Paenibacillus elgii]NEN83129.1 hypothetical protein [Paenibacillus elgii]